jgi:pimeloyl-ACP methyl ester carboxylesterase
MKFFGCGFLLVLFVINGFSQVDTTYVYNNTMPYGSLDIRIAKSSSDYYFLEEGKTFSFRESGGVRTNTYLDMTSWDSSPYIEGNLRERTPTGDLFVMNYRMLKPDGYNATYQPGYPMIVMLHGLGESANCWKNICHHADQNWSPLTNSPAAPTDADSKLLNNDHPLTNGGYQHLKARNEAGSALPNDGSLSARAFPGFVVFPQNLNGWDVQPIHDLIRIVRLIAKKYNIDENRIYVTGLSNGGQGAYEAAKRAPWLFASLLTMSAIGDANIHPQGLASSVAHIPMWTFQGALDQNPLPAKTENYVKQFRDAGAQVRFTKYDNVGHGTWNLAFAEPDYFSWLLKGNKSTIHSFAGTRTICQSGGLQLELASGFLAYQWELNGQIISGATTSTYTATQAGKYRARFSRIANPGTNDWNQWSEVIELTVGQGLTQAIIKQEGTTLLNDLNNNTNAYLTAEGNFGHYYWYKDGTLVNFAGEQDDTIKHAIITPTMGKGIYTLVVSNFDNCKSPVSEGKSVIFNNQAPITITAPSNFSGVVNNAGEITLNWADQSGNETGFEIWRRRRLEEANYSPWVMATITKANVQTYKDIGLYPSSEYQYKIRAVSGSARSNYTPSSSTEFLVLTTSADSKPPTAPDHLTIKLTGVQQAKLSWSPATDDTGIRQYVVIANSDSIYTNSSDTTFIFDNLPLNNIISIKVRAMDHAGNRGPACSVRKTSTFISGLFYQHSTGATFTLDSIDWSRAEFTGMIQTFSLSPKTQDDFFNFRFDGFIFINTPGQYQFRTASDDGSRLRLDKNLIVENNGEHRVRIVTSSAITLSAGAHRINVDYFDYIDDDSLLVEYIGPDTNNEWTEISVSVLKSAENIVTAIEPETDPVEQLDVNVYPNPTTPSNINVEIRSNTQGHYSLQLFDQLGRNVYVKMLQDLPNEKVTLATEQSLSPGLYFLNVKHGGQSVTRRVIIRP